MSDPVAAERVAQIRTRLEAAFTPSTLEVIDESHLHHGHAGARSGKGHFRVRIGAPAFTGQSRLAAHRLVYGALGDLFETDIHALSVEIADA